MDTLALQDLYLLHFGSEVTMCGAIFTGRGRTFVVPFPDEREIDLAGAELLRLSAEDFAKLLAQLDVVDVELANKAVVRKSQRRIDSAISWAVFARDDYRCRYCGERKPLTVDHVDLWEDGGISMPGNLVAACGPCNRARGRTPYPEWIASNRYAQRAKHLPVQVHKLNVALVETLPYLQTLRQEHQRSR